MTRVYAILVVAFVVLLAGCGGPGPGAESPSPAAGSPTTVPTVTDTPAAGDGDGGESTPTEPPTATPTATATPSPTPVDGRTAAAAALDRNRAAFADVEGYEAQMTMTVETDQGTLSQLVIVREDRTTGEQFVRITQTFPGASLVVEQYEPPNSVIAYQCRISGGECQDQRTILADDVVDFNDSDPTEEQTNLDELPDFTDEGVVSTEFGPMRLFVADGLDSIPEEDRSGDFGEFTDLRMELYFDEDTDLLRQIVFDATIETDDGEAFDMRLVVLYTEFGPVTIEAPDWFDPDATYE